MILLLKSMNIFLKYVISDYSFLKSFVFILHKDLALESCL